MVNTPTKRKKEKCSAENRTQQNVRIGKQKLPEKAPEIFPHKKRIQRR
jgi:hypothetical protein